MLLRLSVGAVARVLVNRGYTPGRDVELHYAVELDPTDYPLGTTIVSATLIGAPNFGETPDFTKMITSTPVASGQITDDAASGVGALYFHLDAFDLLPYQGATPRAYEVLVTDSRGKTASLDAGSLVPEPSMAAEPVDHITVAPTTIGLDVGQTQQLTVTAYDANGNVLTGRVVSYLSSVPGVASVSGSGLVTGVGPGSTNLTATVEGKSAQATATLLPVDHVAIDPVTFEILEGATEQLTAICYDTNNNVLQNRVVAWSSSDNNTATVDAATGLVTGVLVGSVVMTATAEGKQATSAGTIDLVAATTLEHLQAQIAALGTVHLTHAIEAGRGHTLTAGNKATVTDVFGSSGWDWGIALGSGFHYDPVTNLFDTESPNTSSAGTDAMQSAITSLLGQPNVVGAGWTIALIVKVPNAHNPNSYEFGILRSDGTNLAFSRAPAPGGQDARWSGINMSGGWGTQNGSMRGELPGTDSSLHVIFVDVGAYNAVLDTGGGAHTEDFVMITGDRDLTAIAHGENAGFSDASMRLVVGRGWPGFDQPGSWKWRDALLFNGRLNNLQRDAVAAYARGVGAVDTTKPAVIIPGNSFIAATNVATEGLFKHLLSDLGSKADFVNGGISGATIKRLIDRIPNCDRYFLWNKRRPLLIVPWMEYLNSFGDGAAQMLADAETWFTNARAEVPAGVTVKFINIVPPIWSTDPTWLTTHATLRASILANAHGKWDDVWDWGNPGWIWGTTAIMSDATRIQVGSGNHPTQFGYDEAASDATHGLIPVLQRYLP